MGVNKKKFSRFTSAISTPGSRLSFLSNSMATVSPEKPPPKMSIRVRRESVIHTLLRLLSSDSFLPQVCKIGDCRGQKVTETKSNDSIRPPPLPTIQHSTCCSLRPKE